MDNPVPEWCWVLYQPFQRSDGLPIRTMLELGQKATRGVPYKPYFESLGVAHTSIDLGGKYKSLRHDLRQPLPFCEPFDMVTNLGTSEHVTEQEPCWENIARLTTVQGIFVSSTPLPGDFPKHGGWYPTEAFYRNFAELNGYAIEQLYVVGDAPCRYINCRMAKHTDVPFAWPEGMWENPTFTANRMSWL